MGIRTVNDPILEGERVFMRASDMKAMEEGDTPVKVKNFTGRSEDNG